MCRMLLCIDFCLDLPGQRLCNAVEEGGPFWSTINTYVYFYFIMLHSNRPSPYFHYIREGMYTPAMSFVVVAFLMSYAILFLPKIGVCTKLNLGRECNVQTPLTYTVLTYTIG